MKSQKQLCIDDNLKEYKIFYNWCKAVFDKAKELYEIKKGKKFNRFSAFDKKISEESKDTPKHLSQNEQIFFISLFLYSDELSHFLDGFKDFKVNKENTKLHHMLVLNLCIGFQQLELLLMEV